MSIGSRWEYVNVIDREGKSIRNDLYHKPEEPASYIIWKEGDKYYAKNGHTGQIPFSGPDASEVIQSAINNLPNGGKIFIKKSIYEISTVLAIKYPIEIESDGAAFRPVTDLSRFVDIRSSDVRISKLTFDGKYPTFKCSRGILIAGSQLAEDIKNITIEQCKFINIHNPDVGSGYLGGFWVEAYTPAGGRAITNISIKDCYFEGCGRGMTINGSNGIISEVEIIGNRVYDSLNVGITCWNITDVLTANNISNNNAVHGISFSFTKNVSVTGNICNDNNQIGIALGEQSDHIDIVSNICRRNGWHGISVDTTTGGTSWDAYFTIIGNVCEGSNNYNGIYVENSNYGIIVGNVCRNNAEHGIAINGRQVHVIGNQSTDNGLYGLRTSSACVDSIIAFNDLLNNTGGALYAEDATILLIKHNKGYATESHGIATIPNGSSTVTVNHGLASSPNVIKLTGTHSEVANCWVTNVTDTQFTINAPSAVTADRNVYWQAEV